MLDFRTWYILYHIDTAPAILIYTLAMELRCWLCRVRRLVSVV